MVGGPRREIERAYDRDERRAGLSDRARDKEDEEREREREERMRQTMKRSVKMLRPRERVRKNGRVVLLSGV